MLIRDQAYSFKLAVSPALYLPRRGRWGCCMSPHRPGRRPPSYCHHTWRSALLAAAEPQTGSTKKSQRRGPPVFSAEAQQLGPTSGGFPPRDWIPIYISIASFVVSVLSVIIALTVNSSPLGHAATSSKLSTALMAACFTCARLHVQRLSSYDAAKLDRWEPLPMGSLRRVGRRVRDFNTTAAAHVV